MTEAGTTKPWQPLAFKEGQEVTVRYTNWRGEIRNRRLSPHYLWFGTTPYHAKPQWLLSALDLDSNETRDFAVSSMRPVDP